MNGTERGTLTEDFQNEQHTMHRKIDDWRQWWKELSDFGQPRFGEMRDRLQTFRDSLAAHFQHEEESGFFQRLVDLEPECESQVTQLLTEHQQFLNDLNRLCSRLGSAEPDFESWGEANQAFEEFLSKLERHEKQEHQLFEIWKNSRTD